MEKFKKSKTDASVPAKGGVDVRGEPEKGKSNPKGPVKGGGKDAPAKGILKTKEPVKGVEKTSDATDSRSRRLSRDAAIDNDDPLSLSSSSSEGEETETESEVPTKPPPKTPAKESDQKRGRGRPPTTGEYIGLASAKKAYVEAQRTALELQCEKEIVERTSNIATTRATRSKTSSCPPSEIPPESNAEFELAEDLKTRVDTALAIVNGVAKVSKGLKGTLQRALKEAVIEVREAMDELSTRTATDEVTLLHVENRRMKAEIAVLRGELEIVRKEFAAACASPVRLVAPRSPEPKTPPPPTSTANLEQKRFAALEENLLLLLEDRFKTLEERIAPTRPATPSAPVASPRSDPPGDKTPPPSPSLISGRPAEEFPPLPNQRESLERAAPLPPPRAHPAPPPPAAAAAESWTTVGRKKRARNRAPSSSGTQPVTTAACVQSTRTGRRRGRNLKDKDKGDVAQAPASQPPPLPPSAKKETVARNRKAPRVRPPKTSAVVLTLKSGAEDRGVTYASLLTQAKSNIRLADLGIEGGLRLRKARTGARILVLPGASSAPKADALAERLRTVFGAEDVRVSRPEKTVSLRVAGLDDCTTEDEVAAAITQATGCPAGSIKMTRIRRGPDGSGSTVVACPVAAAKKLEECKLLVGWASAIVKVLPHRAQGCYRCHELGHVAARCTSQTDRSDQCYRCGKSGHLVTAPCTAKPHCSVCETAGRPAGHQVGGRSCGAVKPTRSKASRKAPESAAADATTPAEAAGTE